MAADKPSNFEDYINKTICTITSTPKARSNQIQAVKSLVYYQKDTILVTATGYGKYTVIYVVGAFTKKIILHIIPLL
jgi:superfamily II DNA or RNA helicase